MQGEGANIGKWVTFVRLSGCNLKCPWCDTNHEMRASMTEKQIISEVKKQGLDRMIITGGEPMRQNLIPLLREAKARDIWIGLETNGTYDLSKVRGLIDYISVSPKGKIKQSIKVDEIRIPTGKTIDLEWINSIPQKIDAKRYLLSPIEKNKKFFLFETMTALGFLNRKRIKWQLSLQAHKLCGIK